MLNDFFVCFAFFRRTILSLNQDQTVGPWIIKFTLYYFLFLLETHVHCPLTLLLLQHITFASVKNCFCWAFYLVYCAQHDGIDSTRLLHAIKEIVIE